MNIDSAVVLAAGEGERLRPLTAHRPKPMLPAGDAPILQRVLDALIDAGIDDIHVVIGYQRDRVRNRLGATYRDRTLTYHVQEPQLGTGHALLHVEDAVSEDLLVVNGDEVIAPETVRQVIAEHGPTDVATLAVTADDDATQFGAVELDGDRVTELVERPGSGDYRLMNAGIYVFGPSIFSEIEQTPGSAGERRITDTVTRLIERSGNVRGVRTEGFRTKVTYPWDLLDLAADIAARGATAASPRTESIYVADSATVHDDAVLRSPAVVGSDTVVEPGAVVGPDVTLGRNVTVEAGATLSRCVIDDDTRIGRSTTLADSVTGTGVVIGPGVTSPGGPADVRVGTTVYEDRALGSVLADRATVGGGATLRPGVLVGPEATVAPGVRVTENVGAGAEVV